MVITSWLCTKALKLLISHWPQTHHIVITTSIQKSLAQEHLLWLLAAVPHNLLSPSKVPLIVALLFRAAIILEEDKLGSVAEVPRAIPRERLLSMRRQVRHFYTNHFSSMQVITLTTLQIINDRVFPYMARKYEDWNELPHPVSGNFSAHLM